MILFRPECLGGPAPRSAKREGGFTLLEVLVALAILAAGLMGLLELLSGSLRLSGGARDVTAASLYASQRLEEALLEPRPAEGRETGLFGRKYRWTTDTSFLPEENDRFQAARVKVTVSWTDGYRPMAVSVVAIRWDPKPSGPGG